jgi:hypothetical protein
MDLAQNHCLDCNFPCGIFSFHLLPILPCTGKKELIRQSSPKTAESVHASNLCDASSLPFFSKGATSWPALFSWCCCPKVGMYPASHKRIAREPVGFCLPYEHIYSFLHHSTKCPCEMSVPTMEKLCTKEKSGILRDMHFATVSHAQKQTGMMVCISFHHP